MGTSQHPENINESIDDKHDTIYSNADVEYNALLHHRYNCEVALAKQLACAASTSTYLRERIDGITIGIAWTIAPHRNWNGIHAGRTFNCRLKVPRIWRGGGSAAEDHRTGIDEEYCNEPISTVMVIVFLVAIIAHVWITYRNIIQYFLLMF